jgi:hypothetical protein
VEDSSGIDLTDLHIEAQRAHQPTKRVLYGEQRNCPGVLHRDIQLVLQLVLDRYPSILCNTARLDANGLSTAVMSEADRAMFNVPAGIYPAAGLTHQA